MVVREFGRRDLEPKGRSWWQIVVVDNMHFDCKPAAFAAFAAFGSSAASAVLAAYSCLGASHPTMVEVGELVHSVVALRMVVGRDLDGHSHSHSLVLTEDRLDTTSHSKLEEHHEDMAYR